MARLAWMTPVMKARSALMALIGRFSRVAATEGRLRPSIGFGQLPIRPPRPANVLEGRVSRETLTRR